MAVRSLLLLERASAALREATLARSDPARDDRWRQDLSAHAIEVFTLKGAIDDLSRRYFDKHQVLWKSSAEQLEDIVDVINMIATKREEAVYLAFKRRRRGRKPHLGHCEEEGTGFDFDLEELKKLVDPRKAARSLEKLAYAEALLFMGDRRAAAELAESLVCPSA